MCLRGSQKSGNTIKGKGSLYNVVSGCLTQSEVKAKSTNRNVPCACVTQAPLRLLDRLII